jgi:hypothetical protein
MFGNVHDSTIPTGSLQGIHQQESDTVGFRMFGVLKDWGTLFWGTKNISFVQYWGQLSSG